MTDALKPAMHIISGSQAPLVLAHPHVKPAPYIDRYAVLADRLKLDFRAIRFTLDHVPLCLDGDRHASQRTVVAHLIAEGRGRVTDALPRIVARCFAPIARPGPHDLLVDTVLPCVEATLRALIGADLGLTRDSLISRVFSQTMGVAKRRRLEQELDDLTARMQAAFPDDDDQRTGSRVALVLLGRDSLIGTLAASLHDFFGRAAGKPLKSVPFDRVPTRTGVPYIDRIAARDGRFVGHDAVAGQVLRCDLQSLETLPAADRLRFFGKGAHVCLGKALSLDLFAAVGTYLSQVETQVAVTDYALRDDDVFNLPESFVIVVQ